MHYRGRSRQEGSPVQRLEAGSPAGRAPAAVDALLALQRLVGNAAVARLMTGDGPELRRGLAHEALHSQGTPTAVVGVAVQRANGESSTQGATTAPGGGTQEIQESEEVTSEEVELLRRYQQESQSPQVRRLLAELIPLLERVTGFTQQQGTGGGHTRNLGGGQYHINYAAGGSETERIAVLVHELTHVAVNEAYDSDMLNYPLPLPPGGATANTEAARQQLRRDQAGDVVTGSFTVHVMRNVARLLELLPGSNLPPDRQTEIRNKLTAHTAQNPFHEYDAVLSHILVWCDRDPAAEAIRSSEFYQALTGMVDEAARWRRSRQAQVTQEPAETLTATQKGLTNQIMVAAGGTRAGPATGPATGGPATGPAVGETGGGGSTAPTDRRRMRDRVKDFLAKLGRIFKRRRQG
jgi:hypothetical protein